MAQLAKRGQDLLGEYKAPEESRFSTAGSRGARDGFWMLLALPLLATVLGCSEAKDAVKEFRQAGRLLAEQADPRFKRASAAPQSPDSLNLPTCSGQVCLDACDQHGLKILLLQQPLELSSPDTECLVCIVNANVICDGRNDQPSTPLDHLLTTRALDLLTLPPTALGERIPQLQTQPIGRLD